jgi:hypothetical protein
MMSWLLLVCMLCLLVVGDGLPVTISRHYSKRRSGRDAPPRRYCVNTCSVAGTVNKFRATGGFWGAINNFCRTGNGPSFYGKTCAIDCESPTPEFGGFLEGCLAVTLVILVLYLFLGITVGLMLELYKRIVKNRVP